MPAPRKPKKVLIQFAVALVVAVILGVVAIVVGFTIITGVTNQAQVAKQEAEKRTAEAEAEKRRLKAEQLSQQQAVKTYKMVEAVANLAPGQPITQDMITLVTTDERPPIGTLTMISQALGKLVKAPIIKGEPLDSSRLLDTGGYILVKDGMRAVTISVSLIGVINGALVPGSHVDVLTSIPMVDKEDKDSKTMVTKTLLQNVPIASIGSNASASGRPPTDGTIPVTVIVTPQEAQKLVLANSLGSFSLTLRNFSDTRGLHIPTEDLTGVLTGFESSAVSVKKMPPAPKQAKNNGFQNVNYSPESSNLPSPLNNAPAKIKYSMQIYRGTGSESVDFQQ
jgi:Flp pilus assembly protein CpaB